MHSRILILDFGSQVTQLIARRVREAGVFSEVVPYDVGTDFIRDYAADGSLKGIILSGGPNSVTEGDTPRVPQIVFELGDVYKRQARTSAESTPPERPMMTPGKPFLPT